MLLAAMFFLVVVIGALIISQVIYVEDAHKTFQSYYAFRGCQQLLTKTANDATCRLASGIVIKMVKYQDKWYLDGDLPVCYFGKLVCL